ncbi:GPI ethanolamine phosphate transferase 1 [Toxorhynchites rutilus septentrionalis]|uniref:GPI ethanolamine phosphate transferase 1 n=1 Tax=Toxorhynchites rutilus septentrionalis TaxID=329112 RepID=UPI0024787BF1|nr:GPI ethanolamine phosphate transferase 1 [Toxorhynchites rutilus septentrionalis]
MIFSIVAFFVHLLFLLSVFYIYFRSPVLNGLPDGPRNEEAIADRVVVFVADGLRAESFLKHHANRTQFLRNVIINKGAFGISHTRVPTESRPGHVALFAGIYEDPSAIFKGWKENPVEFDSIFNRSDTSFLWGSADILPIFTSGINHRKIYTDHYSTDFDAFVSNSNTSALDIWVFDRVKQFFARADNLSALKSGRRNVLFLHLLGLDTSGHVHKPYSDLFSENLLTVDKGIEEIVRLIDVLTNNDRRTLYIFTSDHGMTDKGSHGSGHPTETETPFVAWGAGIRHWKKAEHEAESLGIKLGDVTVPRWDLNQADVTPLISALLGIAIPKNNCGKLPYHYLEASDIYVANAMWINVEQLYNQYLYLQSQHNQKWYQWSLYDRQDHYMNLINQLKGNAYLSNETRRYEQMITTCETLMNILLEAIEYYHTYYKYELLFVLSMTMIGWIMILVDKIFYSENLVKTINARLVLTAIGTIIIIYVFNILQGTPSIVIAYFVLPVFFWTPVLSRWKNYVSNISGKMAGRIFLIIGCTELLVASFYQRKVLCLFLITHATYFIFRTRKLKRTEIFPSLILLCVSNIVLSGFQMLPVVEKDTNNPYLLLIGVLLWGITNFVITLRSGESIYFCSVQVIVCLLHFLNMTFSIILLEMGYSLGWLSRLISWIILGSSFIVPLFSTFSLVNRVSTIILNFSAPYTMLSLSYEPLFLVAFSASLVAWIRLEDILHKHTVQIAKLSLPSKPEKYAHIDFGDFRRCLILISFILTSFFGTGNMATVSSFDPNWVRLLVTSFSPFLITGLIILKLLIPVFILICAMKALQITMKVESRVLFLIIFVICDIMCLQFFFLIKNKGSWLDIGTSISHFVIMECTTIVFIALFHCANFLLKFSIIPRSKSGEAVKYIHNQSKINMD